MSCNRLNLSEVTAVQERMGLSGGFVAMPAIWFGVPDAVSFQRQLYQWAFEQARQTVQAHRAASIRDLFAIMN
jgi:hypothetical protein